MLTEKQMLNSAGGDTATQQAIKRQCCLLKGEYLILINSARDYKDTISNQKKVLSIIKLQGKYIIY